MSNRVRPVSGSIPAWAGKPRGPYRRVTVRGVYPRVGGETPCGAPPRRGSSGLSPRGRGNPHAGRSPLPCRGSIPAWAGKPLMPICLRRTIMVYPRVGGETLTRVDRLCRAEGLSPRGRGNRGCDGVSSTCRGSIPAWAGKPTDIKQAELGDMVYPRVGGETSSDAFSEQLLVGLSPRGRGNLSLSWVKVTHERSIPAWAGKPTSNEKIQLRGGVYPRVGGETCGRLQQGRVDHGLSPRGRGNHAGPHRPSAGLGSIPAWAGKPTL